MTPGPALQTPQSPAVLAEPSILITLPQSPLLGRQLPVIRSVSLTRTSAVWRGPCKGSQLEQRRRPPLQAWGLLRTRWLTTGPPPHVGLALWHLQAFSYPLSQSAGSRCLQPQGNSSASVPSHPHLNSSPQHPDPSPQHPDPSPQHPDPSHQHLDPSPQQPNPLPKHPDPFPITLTHYTHTNPSHLHLNPSHPSTSIPHTHTPTPHIPHPDPSSHQHPDPPHQHPDPSH